MKLLFGLIGAVLGYAMLELPGAIVLAALGVFAAWLWGERNAALRVDASRPAAGAGDALVRRVAVLEQQVVALQAQLGELQGQPAPAPAPATSPEQTRIARQLAAAAAPMVARAAVAPSPAESVAASQGGVEPPRVAVPVVAPAVAPQAQPAPAVRPVPPVLPVPSAPRTAAPRPPAPPVPLRDRLPPVVARWIFGGNTIVKVGVLILFLGLAFLLRYTAERVTVPVEFRYAGVALVGAVLLGLGWRLRHRRDAAGSTDYGLILQGAGIGVFYLTALGALRLDPLLSVNAAFAFMAGVAVLGAILAVLQDAPWLALVAVAEGFAAPVLVASGSDAYVPLMAYMTILDVGILAMAWFKAWRPLNLVGAVATFALAGGWAHQHYVAADYAGVQAFLLLFFAMFTATGVLFARRALAAGDAPAPESPLAERALDALRQVGRVDSTLTFGVPLAAFSLQYLLVRDMAWGPAWAAAGFALLHILLGGALMRGARPRYALLGEAHVIVGTIFATLAIPLALEGVWTGATWAIEAAGMYWLGARQRRTYARAFALMVVAGAAVRLLTGLSLDLAHGTPLFDGSALGMAMLAVALAAMDVVRRRLERADAGQAPGPVEVAAALLLPAGAALASTMLAWMLCPVLWAGAATAWIAFGCAALQVRAHTPALRVAGVLLHLVALTALSLSLAGPLGGAAPARQWHDLVAALLIGAALLATGWLGIRDAWRAATSAAARPVSMASSIGLVAGLFVASASLLFVLDADRAALAWPWLGLGALWAGTRLRNAALAASAFALQLAAGVATLVAGPSPWSTVDGAVFLAPALWGPLVLAGAGLALGDLLRQAAAGPRAAWWHSTAVQWAAVAWTLAWWSRVLPPMVWRALEADAAPEALRAWPHWLVMWMTLSAFAALAVARWRDWRVLGQASLAIVPLWWAMAFGGTQGFEAAQAPPSADLGWLAWPLALLAHPLLLRQQARWRPPVLAAPQHVAGLWLFVALATRECALRAQQAATPGSAWVALATMVVPALVLATLARPATLRRWPFSEQREAYLLAGCAPIALWLFGWLWLADTNAGNAAPLPYVPLLNPLEIGQGLALLALVGWVRAWPPAWRARVAPQAMAAVLGASAFGLLTSVVLRACHHWAGVAWNGDALFASTLAQAALSVTWSLVGVALMLGGHRAAQRAPWIVGATLLALVVAKLFLVELADRDGLYRVVSFIVVGVLMLVVGYFAPMPPRRPDAAPATAPLAEAS